MNAEQVARLLGISAKTVHRHIAKGTIVATYHHAQELSIASDQVEILRSVLSRDTSACSQDMSGQIVALTKRVTDLEDKVRTLESRAMPDHLDENPSVSSQPSRRHQEPARQKNRIVEPKRAYKRKIGTGLPDGCILATDFATRHGVKRETFRDHMNIGLGPGFIHGPDIPLDGSVQVKDYVKSEERIKRTRFDKNGKEVIEREHYLTPEQQTAALAFWRRHSVEFTIPEQSS
jgi:hypothetical protein